MNTGSRKCILVHGGMSGSVQWKKIAGYLGKHDISTTSPQLPGMGSENPEGIDLDDHIAYLSEVIKSSGGDSCVAAFSFGGLAATAACCSCSGYVKRIIYIDSFFPFPGESFKDIIGKKISRQIFNILNHTGRKIIPYFLTAEENCISQPAGTIFTKVNYAVKDLSGLNPHYIRLSGKDPGWTFTPVLDEQFTKYCSKGFKYSVIEEAHTLNGRKWNKIACELKKLIFE